MTSMCQYSYFFFQILEDIKISFTFRLPYRHKLATLFVMLLFFARDWLVFRCLYLWLTPLSSLRLGTSSLTSELRSEKSVFIRPHDNNTNVLWPYLYPACVHVRIVVEGIQTVRVTDKTGIYSENQTTQEQWVIIRFYTLDQIRASCHSGHKVSWPQASFTTQLSSATFLRLPGRIPRPGVWWWEGRCVGINPVSLFSALNQLGNVQACRYVIFTSSSLRFEVEPLWLVAASPTTLVHFSQDWAAGPSIKRFVFNEHLFQVKALGGRQHCVVVCLTDSTSV